MREIYVIGSMSIDLVTESDRRPVQGETILGNKFFMTTGGKGANQAVSAARLGGDVYMLGCIGNDAFGQMIIDNLQSNHVKTDYVETIPDVPSGTATISLTDNDNSIVVVPSANYHVTIQQVSHMFEQMPADALIVLQNEIPLEVIEYVINQAYKKQLTVIYNPAPFIDIDTKLLDKVTYFTPNETEVVSLFGQNYTDVIEQYRNKMIVTLGDKGATYFGDTLVNVPAESTTVVDTTGAGDTFNGALAVGISEGMTLTEAISFGNKAAAKSVTGLGAMGGMPYRKDMDNV